MIPANSFVDLLLAQFDLHSSPIEPHVKDKLANHTNFNYTSAQLQYVHSPWTCEPIVLTIIVLTRIANLSQSTLDHVDEFNIGDEHLQQWHRFQTTFDCLQLPGIVTIMLSPNPKCQGLPTYAHVEVAGMTLHYEPHKSKENSCLFCNTNRE